jgi:predicted Zn-dependent protease
MSFLCLGIVSQANASCAIVYDYDANERMLGLLKNSCNALLAVSDNPRMVIKVIATDKIKYPNAFATYSKGENIIIFTKLMLVELEKKQRALPFIVGHELAHLLSGHVSSTKKEEIIDGIITSAKSSFGSLFPGGSHSAVDLSIKAIEISNSQHKEIEADLISKRMMLKAGYSQSDVIFAIDLLISQSKTSSWERFFSTHPDPGTRKRHLTN